MPGNLVFIMIACFFEPLGNLQLLVSPLPQYTDMHPLTLSAVPHHPSVK